MDWGGSIINPFALFVRMRMGGNEHSGSSAMPWRSKDSNAFGGLHQFSAEFVYLGTCLGRLGLGGGDEALPVFCNGLGLMSCNDNFLSSTALAFVSFMALCLAWS
jgi:hypothetical protein